jgi:PleD family two-component response regulator
VTISLGVAERRPGDELKDFTRRVDEALYCAKGRGRNQVVVAR